ncbi:MAG: hypothetical protein JWQ57_4093 [Mucilaginibacter sp.]|nr:hypothetical protein [Mucilaginibacter sp.]
MQTEFELYRKVAPLAGVVIGKHLSASNNPGKAQLLCYNLIYNL